MDIDLVDIKHWRRHLKNPEPYAGLSQTDADNLIALLPEGRDVLCVGCGDGYEVEALDKQERHAIGITRNKDEVEKALENSRAVILADMHDLPFTDEMFDLVFCRDAWEHSIAPYIALAEMARVLKEGGHALIRLPSEDWIECSYHYSVLTERQVKEMFAKVKLECEVISPGIYLGKKNSQLEYRGKT